MEESWWMLIGDVMHLGSVEGAPTHTHTHAHKLTHSCSHAQVNTLTHTQKMILLEMEYWHSISVFIKGLKKQ